MMQRSLTILLVFAVAVSACSGHSAILGGDSVRQPEPVPRQFTIQVLAGDDLTPLSAAVSVDGQRYDTDLEGRVSMDWDRESGSLERTLSVSATGFEPLVEDVDSYPDGGLVELRLAPVVLRGRVVSTDGRALPLVNVRLGETEVQTDVQGQFTFVRAGAGPLSLSRPAWAEVATTWDGQGNDLVLTMAPRVIRALRVSGPKAGEPSAWSELIELAAGSAINALVIDIKDEQGTVLHDTSVALAHDIGSVDVAYDLDAVVGDMDAEGLYKIARVVAFQDPILATSDSNLAAWDVETGRAWRTGSGVAWLDPTDPAAWDYSLDLGEEACRRGFDEIQFDYVGFPFGGSVSTLQFDDFEFDDYFSLPAQQKRVETVAAYLTAARDRLNPLGCAVAADIFAIVLESPTDEGVGQMPEALSSAVDVLSPMIYTHLYQSGWAGFDEPNDHAPEIVSIAVRAGIQRMIGLGILRPWVQRAFLDESEILAVQAEVEAKDLGWMLWSSTADFNADMLPPLAE